MNKREFTEGVVSFFTRNKCSVLECKILVELCVLYSDSTEGIKLSIFTKRMIEQKLKVSSFSFANAIMRINRKGIIGKVKRKDNYTHYSINEEGFKKALSEGKLEVWVSD